MMLSPAALFTSTILLLLLLHYLMVNVHVCLQTRSKSKCCRRKKKNNMRMVAVHLFGSRLARDHTSIRFALAIFNAKHHRKSKAYRLF